MVEKQMGTLPCFLFKSREQQTHFFFKKPLSWKYSNFQLQGISALIDYALCWKLKFFFPSFVCVCAFHCPRAPNLPIFSLNASRCMYTTCYFPPNGLFYYLQRTKYGICPSLLKL